MDMYIDKNRSVDLDERPRKGSHALAAEVGLPGCADDAAGGQNLRLLQIGANYSASCYVSPINFPGPGGTVTLLDVSKGRGRQAFHGGGRW